MQPFVYPRYSQPQGPARIDRGNVFGSRVIDGFIGTSPFTSAGKAITRTASLLDSVNLTGPGRRGNANSAFDFPCNLSAYSEITIVLAYTQNTGAAAFEMLMEHGPNLSTPGSFYLGVTTGVSEYGTGHGVSFDNGTIPRLPVGNPVVFAASLKRTAGNASVDISCFVNGVKQTTTAANNSTVVGNFANDTTHFLGRNSNSYHSRATINGYAVLRGFSSDAELKSLSDNPWQIFSDNRRPIFVGLGAAPAGDTYTLTADSASVALSGQAATLSANRVIPADTASIAFSGQSASLTRGYTIAADTASVAVAGQAASLLSNKVLPLTTASIVLAGQDATLTYSPISGATYTLPATTSSIAITAQDAALVQNRRLAAETLAFDLAVQAATLTHGYVMQAASGDYALAGQDATLTYSPSGVTYALFLDSSLIPFIGNDVTFPYLPPAPLTQSGSGGSGGAFKVRRSKEFNDLINTIVAKAGNIPAVVAKSAPPQASPEKLELVVAALEDVAVWVNKRKRAVIAAEVIQLQERLQELEDEEQAVALLLLS